MEFRRKQARFEKIEKQILKGCNDGREIEEAREAFREALRTKASIDLENERKTTVGRLERKLTAFYKNKRHSSTVITSIAREDGDLVTDPHDILECFRR